MTFTATHYMQTCTLPLLEKVNKIHFRLVLINVCQSVVTHKIDHNTIYKYQVNLIWPTIYKNVCPPFILHLNVENAQNPVQKQFEKTNKGDSHVPNYQKAKAHVISFHSLFQFTSNKIYLN